MDFLNIFSAIVLHSVVKGQTGDKFDIGINDRKLGRNQALTSKDVKMYDKTLNY